MNDYIRGVYDASSAALEQMEKRQSGNNQEDAMDLFRHKIITRLFLDCVQYHGCNGRFVSTTKLQNSLQSAWVKLNDTSIPNELLASRSQKCDDNSSQLGKILKLRQCS